MNRKAAERNHHYPKDRAWRKAMQACNDFIAANQDYDIDITFAVLDDSILQMGFAERERQAVTLH